METGVSGRFLELMRGLLHGDEVQEFVADSTRDALQGWYAALPEDWFDNPEPFPDGTSRRGTKRSFMFPLSNVWQVERGAGGFSLLFKQGREGGSNWGLRLQQYGGEIRPVKKRALTIPVTNAARGRSVREFEAATGHRLFRVGTKEGDYVGSLVWEDPTGDLHAAYVLRTRSRVPSLNERRGHDALPDERLLGGWAAQAWARYAAVMLG